MGCCPGSVHTFTRPEKQATGNVAFEKCTFFTLFWGRIKDTEDGGKNWWHTGSKLKIHPWLFYLLV